MREQPDYYYDQSSVIPVRRQGDSFKVLMISSRKGKRWIFPKGIIESDLSPADSAAKEALEEAGVAGVVLPEMLGRYRYYKWGDYCDVQVFVLRVTEVLDVWLEDFRQRAWLDWEDAMGRVEETELQALLQSLPDHLEQYES
ncbi:MAG: NUDIX hydrolase [Magnetococcales bacterium]|nr:NUDIX hydrolase [Magnetococcales bacterium]